MFSEDETQIDHFNLESETRKRCSFVWFENDNHFELIVSETPSTYGVSIQAEYMREAKKEGRNIQRYENFTVKPHNKTIVKREFKEEYEEDGDGDEDNRHKKTVKTVTKRYNVDTENDGEDDENQGDEDHEHEDETQDMNGNSVVTTRQTMTHRLHKKPSDSDEFKQVRQYTQQEKNKHRASTNDTENHDPSYEESESNLAEMMEQMEVRSSKLKTQTKPKRHQPEKRMAEAESNPNRQHQSTGKDSTITTRTTRTTQNSTQQQQPIMKGFSFGGEQTKLKAFTPDAHW